MAIASLLYNSEHLKGVSMKEAGLDALSRWGEFTVRGDVFRSMHDSPRWGKYAGRKGYTVDLYASALSKKCKRYGARGELTEAQGGALGCIGDARTAKLGTRENAWVCPPLAVVQQSIMAFMERRTVGTVIVPEWEAQAWYVWLRERAVHSMPMPWSRELPTMQDVASHGA